jgi:hypothetical protein
MAYLNCPYCPYQSYSTGRYVYHGLLDEFQCVSKHKFYAVKERDDERTTTDEGSRSGTGEGS